MLTTQPSRLTSLNVPDGAAYAVHWSMVAKFEGMMSYSSHSTTSALNWCSWQLDDTVQWTPHCPPIALASIDITDDGSSTEHSEPPVGVTFIPYVFDIIAASIGAVKQANRRATRNKEPDVTGLCENTNNVFETMIPPFTRKIYHIILLFGIVRNTVNLI